MMEKKVETLDALVSLTRCIRPTWDVPGIRHAIRGALAREVQPSIAELAYALIRCAENPTIATPAVVAMDGAHWGKSTRDPQEPLRATKCRKCQDFHIATRPCEPNAWMHRPVDPERILERVAAARAEIAHRKATGNVDPWTDGPEALAELDADEAAARQRARDALDASRTAATQDTDLPNGETA